MQELRLRQEQQWACQSCVKHGCELAYYHDTDDNSKKPNLVEVEQEAAKENICTIKGCFHLCSLRAYVSITEDGNLDPRAAFGYLSSSLQVREGTKSCSHARR